MTRLNQEFDQMIAHPQDVTDRIDQKENFINLRLMMETVSRESFPETTSTFTQSWMADVAERFFHTKDFRLNWETFVSQSGEFPAELMTSPPFALHFDKRQVLKFFYYLTDTNADNGALRATPGTHLIIKKFREEQMSSGRPLGEIPNVVEDAVPPAMSLDLPAGSLIVFTTDVAHGHSAVKAGQMRKTMRGHTHDFEMLRAMGHM